VDVLGALRPTVEAEGAAGTTGGESIGDVALEPLPAQRRRRMAFKVAAFLSVLLHAGSLYAFINWHNPADVGAASAVSEAISVEIVTTKTLEALQEKQVPEPVPAPEATAPVEGKTEAAEAKVAKTEETPPPEPEIIVPPQAFALPELSQELAPPAKQAEAPVKTEAPPLPELGPTEAPPKPANTDTVDRIAPPKPPPKPPEKKKAAERAPKGGTTSKAQSGKGTGGERASASTGALINYAAHVRARVAANKPSGGGLRGTAMVSFGLTTSGALAFASVARSSGNSTLDGLAVAAVRQSAPFPRPPDGATSAQLRFSIPFYFQ
jgi:protein TonB